MIIEFILNNFYCQFSNKLTFYNTHFKIFIQSNQRYDLLLNDLSLIKTLNEKYLIILRYLDAFITRNNESKRELDLEFLKLESNDLKL